MKNGRVLLAAGFQKTDSADCRLLTALEVEECLRKGRLARWSSKYNEQYEMDLEELDPE